MHAAGGVAFAAGRGQQARVLPGGGGPHGAADGAPGPPLYHHQPAAVALPGRPAARPAQVPPRPAHAQGARRPRPPHLSFITITITISAFFFFLLLLPFVFVFFCIITIISTIASSSAALAGRSGALPGRARAVLCLRALRVGGLRGGAALSRHPLPPHAGRLSLLLPHLSATHRRPPHMMKKMMIDNNNRVEATYKYLYWSFHITYTTQPGGGIRGFPSGRPFWVRS